MAAKFPATQAEKIAALTKVTQALTKAIAEETKRLTEESLFLLRVKTMRFPKSKAEATAAVAPLAEADISLILQN